LALQTVTVSIQGDLSVAQSREVEAADALPLFAHLKVVLRDAQEQRLSRSAEPVSGDFLNRVINGDCMTVMKSLPTESVDCVITSPPYFALRDYGVDGQIGLEETPGVYTQKLVELFRETRRVLKSTGTLWLNLGDSYASGGKRRAWTKAAEQPWNTCACRHGEKGAPRSKAEGPHRYPIARRLRSSGRWLVSPPGHHLGEAKSHA